MKKLLASLLPLIIPFLCQAQANILQDSAAIRDHLSRSHYDVDSDAAAVVLYEKGTYELFNFEFIFKVERTIKILRSDAINDLSTVSILKIKGGASINKIKGTTYNLENGKVTVQDIEKEDVLTDKILASSIDAVKFNLPSVKVGSIIHYTYTHKSYSYYTVPDWIFQGDYPCLYSEYEISVPHFVVYADLARVYTPMEQVFTKADLGKSDGTYFREVDIASQQRQTWVRKNIPAFKDEPLMPSKSRYIERVRVQITALTYGAGYRIYKNWDELIKANFYDSKTTIGQAFDRNNFLEPLTKRVTGTTSDSLEMAKAIFSFVRDSITLIPKADDNLKKMLQTYQATASGKNLLLVSMLRKAGFKAQPFFVAERPAEPLNEVFQRPGDLSFMGIRLYYKEHNYYLNAANRHSSFGMIHTRAYNGYCRTVDEVSEELVLTPNNLIDKTTYLVTIKPSETDEQTLRIQFTARYGEVTALTTREQWAADTNLIRKKIHQDLLHSELTLESYELKNLHNPDAPLTITYNCSYDIKNKDLIYLNLLLARIIEKNPFDSRQRVYPVELPYLQDINYTLHLKLPENYILEDVPQTSKAVFGNDLINMSTQAKYSDELRNFSLNFRFTTTETLFGIDAYDDLRSYFDKLQEVQDSRIVLAKRSQ
jgi:effector-binding domain-containing protein